MYDVVTQLGLGLHVVYFSPFAGTGPLVQTMFCRLFILLKPERLMGLGLSVIDYAQQPTGTSLSAAILDLDRRQDKVEEGNFSKQGQVIIVIRVLVLFSDTT